MTTVLIESSHFDMTFQDLNIENRYQIQLMRASAVHQTEEAFDSSSDGVDDNSDEEQLGSTVLTKKMVKDKKLTLKNLTKYLRAAMNGLQQIEKADDLILAIGNTGCGKSTMIISLLYGPESLEEKVIEVAY